MAGPGNYWEALSAPAGAAGGWSSDDDCLLTLDCWRWARAYAVEQHGLNGGGNTASEQIHSNVFRSDPHALIVVATNM
jgi:hypothetical protein